MPRPGPRPYECVRRAWHSDRHQPIRGSIIQRIFKLVYERHGAVTRKNNEWQAKLPIVVLKAEEIMYSKADSEAQYMDLETVWDRVNDAIDTIIRRDESTETGELLPPCVEAALNLGCVPERASRSQRHNNPRTYLSPRTQEGGYAASKVSGGNTTDVRNRSLLPPYSGNQSNLERSTGSLEPLVSESNRHLVPNVNSPSTSSSKNLNFPTDSQIAWKDGKASFNVGSVYPLYYGTSFQPDISRLGSQEPHVSKDIIVGRPIFASVEKPAEIGCIRTLLANEANSIAPKQADAGERPEVECDLSLRLGPFSNSILCRGKGTKPSVNDKIDPANPSEMGEVKVVSSSSSSSREKDFSLFSLEAANDPSSFCLGRYNVEGEGRQNVETFLRKRKLPFGSSSADNRQILWQLKPTPHHFADQMKKQTS